MLPIAKRIIEDHYNIFAYALKLCYCYGALNEIIYKWYHNGTYLSVNTFSLWMVQLKHYAKNVEQGIPLGCAFKHTSDEQWWNQVNPHAVCNYCVFASYFCPSFRGWRYERKKRKNVQLSIQPFHLGAGKNAHAANASGSPVAKNTFQLTNALDLPFSMPRPHYKLHQNVKQESTCCVLAQR